SPGSPVNSSCVTWSPSRPPLHCSSPQCSERWSWHTPHAPRSAVPKERCPRTASAATTPLPFPVRGPTHGTTRSTCPRCCRTVRCPGSPSTRCSLHATPSTSRRCPRTSVRAARCFPVTPPRQHVQRKATPSRARRETSPAPRTARPRHPVTASTTRTATGRRSSPRGPDELHRPRGAAVHHRRGRCPHPTQRDHRLHVRRADAQRVQPGVRRVRADARRHRRAGHRLLRDGRGRSRSGRGPCDHHADLPYPQVRGARLHEPAQALEGDVAVTQHHAYLAAEPVVATAADSPELSLAWLLFALPLAGAAI